DPGDAAETDLADDRQRDLADHLAGMGGDDGAAEDLIGALHDVDFHEARFLAFDDGSIDVAHRNFERIDLDAPLLRVALVHADVGDFGVGVRAPRYGQRAQLLAPEKQGVLNDDARAGVGSVRELVPQAHVTDRVDQWIGGLQVIVHAHALWAVLYL